MKTFYVYILECSDRSYYTGITSNLEKRMTEHHAGSYEDSYTHKRRPVQLVYYTTFTESSLAIDTEKQIKKWSRAKKEALIKNDFKSLRNLARKDFSSD